MARRDLVLASNDFECDDGMCIPQHMLGNGVNDCVDGSDEAGKSQAGKGQAGAIAGAVVGSLVFVVAATLVAWWSCRNCSCCSVCGKGAETAATKENTDPAHMPIENQAYEFTDPAAEPAADSGVINVVGSWDDEFTASAAAPAAATTDAEPAADSAVINAVGSWDDGESPAAVPSDNAASTPTPPPLDPPSSQRAVDALETAAAADDDENPFADAAAAETAEEVQFKELFASGNPDATGTLSAKTAGALLSKSGLTATALQSVWNDAKKQGPGTCPTDKMDVAEFLVAASLAVEAGGKFDISPDSDSDLEC